MRDPKQRLVIFTRFPEPGKTKTRLIPELGEEGAADLQKQMTEHTLTVARQALGSADEIVVYYTGQNESAFKAWLGEDVLFVEQSAGDLGHRMHMAIHEGLVAGLQRVVIVGIDCPQITPAHLREAFASLQRYDVVLGPAFDGGYYLVGSSTAKPNLFQGIRWGTSTVFEKTIDIANQNGWSVKKLETLRDVDLPEDLPIWDQVRP